MPCLRVFRTPDTGARKADDVVGVPDDKGLVCTDTKGNQVFWDLGLRRS
jgi:hypothetical protein